MTCYVDFMPIKAFMSKMSASWTNRSVFQFAMEAACTCHDQHLLCFVNNQLMSRLSNIIHVV